MKTYKCECDEETPTVSLKGEPYCPICKTIKKLQPEILDTFTKDKSTSLIFFIIAFIGIVLCLIYAFFFHSIYASRIWTWMSANKVEILMPIIIICTFMYVWLSFKSFKE